MTTRTKLALCAGLIAVAVGVAVAFRSPAKPEVELKFMRYDRGGWALLDITNSGPTAVYLPSSASKGGLLPGDIPSVFDSNRWATMSLPAAFTLISGQSTQLWALPKPSASVFSLRWGQERSELRHLIENLLLKVGVSIYSTGYVTTVDLPPRATDAPAQPLTP